MNIYFDNAATTPLDEKVRTVMKKTMDEVFGNPSSVHVYGREAKVIIENARKTIARLLNVSSSEIFFTSGGTEANNLAIRGAIESLGITHTVTSAIEHPSVLNTLNYLKNKKAIEISYVRLQPDGHIDLQHLEELLQKEEKSFVSLMHANNEIGNLLPLHQVSQLCEKYHAVFHSDTVQTIGHYPFNLKNLTLHFLSGSAHKFHGPKGIGFLYVNSNSTINSLLLGGSQERNLRAGTENIYGIAGMESALKTATENLEEHQQQVQELKQYMIEQLEDNIEGIEFNGDAKGKSLYTILNVRFPETDKAEMLLYNLDIAGIAVSGGSACNSGSNQKSHVLDGIQVDSSKPSIRFSFSKHNTKEEVDYCISILKRLLR